MKRRIEIRLQEWNRQRKPLPLMLIGAKQTGKTYILDYFCRKNFDNIVHLNFFENADFATFFRDSLNVQTILANIELYFGKKIDVEKTIFFFDEIQECEAAIASLKFFAEDPVPFKIVTAGSLLGVKLKRMKMPFPVGKLQIEYLYPMDFEEFLWALDEDLLADTIKEHFISNSAFPEIIHKKTLHLYRNYLCIGGMPASIKNFAENQRDLLRTDLHIKDNIFTGYLSDMTKYAGTVDSIKIHQVYRTMPAQLAKPQTKFMYKTVEKGGNAEIDYVANLTDGLIPIEVKSSRNVNSKSLSSYVEKYKPQYSIRVSQKNFGFENNIKSTPLYATFCIKMLNS